MAARPFHVAAFTESVDQALDNLAALSDQVLFTSGDDMVLPDGLHNLLGVWIGSATAERGRIVAPSLRERVLPDLMPVDTAVSPSISAGAGSPPLHGFWDMPFQLKPSERLNIQLENDAAGAGEQATAVVFLGSGPVTPAPGRWWPLRATTTAAAVTANAWSNRTLALAQSLPPGRYQMGGAIVRSTTIQAARFLFPGGGNINARPGCLGHAAASLAALAGFPDIYNHGETVFRNGMLGVWGEFTHDQPPTVDLLCNAADNEAQDLIIDVRKIG